MGKRNNFRIALVLAAFLVAGGGVVVTAQAGHPPTSTTTTTRVRPPRTTTTTTAPPVVLPATIPHPDHVSDAMGFVVNVKGKLVGCSQNSGPECGPELTYWDAPYLYDLPYLAGDNGWRDGDRQGYECLYAGLQSLQKQIGGVRFVKVEVPRTITTGFYGIIKDAGMNESESPGPAWNFGGVLEDPQPRFEGECIGTDLDYSSLVQCADPFRGRIGYLNGAAKPVEIRDYSAVDAMNGVVICLFEVDTNGTSITVASGTYFLPQQIAVVDFFQGTPQHVIYYYSFGAGRLVLEP